MLGGSIVTGVSIVAGVILLREGSNNAGMSVKARLPSRVCVTEKCISEPSSGKRIHHPPGGGVWEQMSFDSDHLVMGRLKCLIACIQDIKGQLLLEC